MVKLKQPEDYDQPKPKRSYKKKKIETSTNNKTQTCKQEYASAGHKKSCKGFKKKVKKSIFLKII